MKNSIQKTKNKNQISDTFSPLSHLGVIETKGVFSGL